MAFWSGEKLAQELPNLITGFDTKNLDCASYRLSVGDQVFATSDKFTSSSPTEPLVSVLKAPPENILRIRPGQFAFLMTSESVTVPDDALALISIRAGYKFRGLINVSGFHVDPGWQGNLLFSVYNAGPTVVTLKRHEPMFLIVYADLDQNSTKIYNGKSKGQINIDPSLLENMTEQVFSPLMLQRQLDELKNKVTQTASSQRVVINTVIALLSLFFAFLAIIATFAPGSLGVVLAKVIESAGYEIKQKLSSDSSSNDGQKFTQSIDQPKTVSSVGGETVKTSTSTTGNEK